MLTSLEWLFSWPWHHGHRTKRLELAYCQFSSLVSEIPATLDCIDFEGPPDRLEVTKTGGYPMGLGTEAGGQADLISHIMASYGNGAQLMARRAIDSPIDRRYQAPRASFAGSIRPLGPRPKSMYSEECCYAELIQCRSGHPHASGRTRMRSRLHASPLASLKLPIFAWPLLLESGRGTRGRSTPRKPILRNRLWRLCCSTLPWRCRRPLCPSRDPRFRLSQL